MGQKDGFVDKFCLSHGKMAGIKFYFLGKLKMV
jgi:hypothetical protein